MDNSAETRSTHDGEPGTGYRPLAALAACIGLALTVGPTRAEQATNANAAGPNSDALSEIVVTAEFRREKLQQTPIAITALSSDALAARNITTLVDVASAAPNVTMFESSAAYGKTNAAFIRGIGQADFNFASAEPGVGIYIDDVYHATTFGSMFDLLDLDRVEVLRGPQGTLFGKNSIGGAIRLISKKPEGDGSGFAEVTLGDYNRREVRAGFDVALVKDVLMLRVTAMSKNRDGYVDRVDYACAHPDLGASQGYAVNPAASQLLNSNSLGSGSCRVGTEGGVDVKGARAQLRWVPSDTVENNFTVDWMDDNSEAAAEVMLVANPSISPSLQAFNGAGGFVVPAGKPFPGLLNQYGVNYDSRFVTAGTYTTYSTFHDSLLNRAYPPVNTVHSYGSSDVFTWKIADNVSLKSITAYRGYWGDFSDDQSNSPLPVAYAYNLLDHHQFTQEFQLTGQAFDNRLDWAGGLFYYDGFSLNRGHINLNFLQLVPGVFGLDFNQDDPARTKDKAAFVQTTYGFTDTVHLTTGVRYTKEDKNYTFDHQFFPTTEGSTSYNHTDWKIGIDDQLTRDVLLYTSVSTGFRAGGLNPRPFSGAQVLPFGPEKTTSFEVGAKSEWFERRLRANLAAYLSKYKDVVINSQRLDSTGLPFTGPENVGAADIKGFEFELEARPVPNLSISASVGLTDFKWKSLGTSEGCQDLGAAAIVGVNCISGNPGYSDIAPGISKWKGNVGVQYAIPVGGGGSVTPRVDANYSSARYGNNYNNYAGPDGVGPLAVTPALTLLTARLTWQDAQNLWSASAFGNNLTNKYYYQSFLDLRSFGEGQMSAQPGEPREWGVTVSRKF